MLHKAKICKLSKHMLVGIPIVGQIHAPSRKFRFVPNAAENLVTIPSVAVVSESEENVENLIEPVAPMEHEEDMRYICVVGEIVTPEKVF